MSAPAAEPMLNQDFSRFDQVRKASAAGRCFRELPLIWQAPDGMLVEGTIDLG